MSSVLEPLRQLPAELLDEPCALCGHPGGLHWQPYGGCCVVEECTCNAFVKGATPDEIATLEPDATTPVQGMIAAGRQTERATILAFLRTRHTEAAFAIAAAIERGEHLLPLDET